ncbi:argininosuccinate lyase [Roseibacterium beibuensis]|uniref:Argininosuccinate lyase n=1 Tax=[Roseibacterium] beibuensis TaxID=1193142 RepID=A0ABP9LDH0_9RHOB|nr:argininosuccinate lyase [Roseibacterium beibuensis]MCS6626677.1 argininosuccinate lyase [Roseibacterium beibuensis]
MTFRLTLMIAAMTALLAGCGADGEPETPDRAEPGITISGTVEVGVSGRF